MDTLDKLVTKNVTVVPKSVTESQDSVKPVDVYLSGLTYFLHIPVKQVKSKF